MEQALVVSNVLLWIAVLALAAVVFALVRQIGVLYERVAPAGALVLAGGPKVGEAAPRFALDDVFGRATALGGDDPEERADAPVLRVADLSRVQDAPARREVARRGGAARAARVRERRRAEDHVAFARKHALEAYPYVVSTELGLAHQVGKLPHAVLLGRARDRARQGPRELARAPREPVRGAWIAAWRRSRSTWREPEDRDELDRLGARALRAARSAAHLAAQLPRAARRGARRRRRRGRCCPSRARAPKRARMPAHARRRPGNRIPRAASTGATARSTAFCAAAAAAARRSARPARRWRPSPGSARAGIPPTASDYVISYNDCCGKDFCGRCICNRNEGDKPAYITPRANDINWCVAADEHGVQLLDRDRDRSRNGPVSDRTSGGSVVSAITLRRRDRPRARCQRSRSAGRELSEILLECGAREGARERPNGGAMDTTRLAILAFVLSALVVERTFARDLEASDARVRATVEAERSVPAETAGLP